MILTLSFHFLLLLPIIIRLWWFGRRTSTAEIRRLPLQMRNPEGLGEDISFALPLLLHFWI